MPTMDIPEKLEPFLNSPCRINIAVGGRGSAKSETIGRLGLFKVQTERADLLCGREFQNTIDDSVHKLLKELIETIPVPGFQATDKKIDCVTGGGVRYKGFSRNPDAIRSAQGFKYCWIEEAQFLSQDSIDALLPTIRSSGSQFFLTANLMSQADPFSERFINPFYQDLLKQGYFIDDMHYIIVCNWRDNPWHKELELQRLWDFNNLSRSRYNWIWEFAFNDSVEEPLILDEWFDAAIDAHIKLGFEPRGIKYASHDPSDKGPDVKGYAYRHGSIILDLQERTEGDVNEGCDWATGLAINQGVDAFVWDCDGLGVSLNRQVSTAFQGKPSIVRQFRGSNEVENPDETYDPAEGVQNQKTNKESFKNKRVQMYAELRDRFYRTYRAVVHKEYHDPEKMISLSSNLLALNSLRPELCRLPIKPNANGLLDLYTKAEMKNRFKFKSPNLADALMMLMDTPPPIHHKHEYVMPTPIKPMGAGQNAISRRY